MLYMIQVQYVFQQLTNVNDIMQHVAASGQLVLLATALSICRTKNKRVMVVEYPNMIWKGQDICAAWMKKTLLCLSLFLPTVSLPGDAIQHRC